MARRLLKALFGALLIGTAATSAAGPAWASNGPLNFTATAPATRLTISSSPTVAVNCSTNRLVGTLAAPSAPPPVMTLGFQFSTCSITGLAFTESCVSNAGFYAMQTMLGVTKGSISGYNCTITRGGSSCIIKVTGSIDPAYYYNAAGTVPAHFLFDTTAESLTAMWSGCTGLFNAPGGSAGAVLSQQAGGTSVTYTVTSNPPPAL